MKRAETALAQGDRETCKELSARVDAILQKTRELAALWLRNIEKPCCSFGDWKGWHHHRVVEGVALVPVGHTGRSRFQVKC